MQNARNNLLAGVFVLVGLGLAVWVSFLLSDRSSYAAAANFTVRFPVATGASGLKRGSVVMLGGQPIGRVLEVGFHAPEGVADAVDVRVEVRDDLKLYRNAVVNLERPILGTLSSINIVNPGAPVGEGSAPVERLGDKDFVIGRIAPPTFLADVGFGPEQAAQIRAAIASIDVTMKHVAEIMETSGPGVNQSVADARAMLGDLRGRLNVWSERIDATTSHIEAASGRLDPLLQEAQGGIADARAAITSVKNLVDDNRGRIDAIVASLESAAGKIDNETVESVNEALRKGRDALGVFSDAVARVSALVGEQTPSLRRTMANLRLMSDQLKLTAVEVRSQPWRLLHKPTTKEMSSQVLYDATRAYAEASSDLRAASEAMQAAAAIEAAGGDDSDMAVLSDRLNEALSRYRQAETYLFDRVLQAQEKK